MRALQGFVVVGFFLAVGMLSETASAQFQYGRVPSVQRNFRPPVVVVRPPVNWRAPLGPPNIRFGAPRGPQIWINPRSGRGAVNFRGLRITF
jgi:hypothetical protein